MQRGLIGQRAGDDGLRVISFDVQAAEPGSPPAVEDALDADLVMGRAAGGAHLRPCRCPGWPAAAPASLAWGGPVMAAGRGHPPKVACGWNLAVMCACFLAAQLGESGRRMAPSSDRNEARWPAE